MKIKCPSFLKWQALENVRFLLENVRRFNRRNGAQNYLDRNLIKDNNTLFLVGRLKVPYEEVIKALNLLHLAGIKSVGLMTNPI